MGDYSSLDPCVHCGFCLPACPTYLVTGDEGHSPRGRIVLMRALERGEMTARDAALANHLDACLGCRGCEPACPSGVGYGRALETAREQMFAQRGLSTLARAVLGVFRYRGAWRAIFTAAKAFRATRLPGLLAGGGRTRFGLGMLASSGEMKERVEWTDKSISRPAAASQPSALSPSSPTFPSSPTVALFRGCVMDTLFRHARWKQMGIR